MYLPVTVGNVIALGFVSASNNQQAFYAKHALHSTLPSSSPTMNARCDSMHPIQSRLRRGSSWLLGPRRCSPSHSFGSGGSQFTQALRHSRLICDFFQVDVIPANQLLGSTDVRVTHGHLYPSLDSELCAVIFSD